MKGRFAAYLLKEYTRFENRAREQVVSLGGSQLSLFGGKYASSSVDEDFVDRLWLLGITLVLIMASGEKLLEPGVGLKTVKAKQQGDRAVEYWSPNYLGRVYRTETESGEVDNHLRPHWRKSHLKSQAHGQRLSLRKIIWIQPYRTGNRGGEKT